ncbi:hypothetical protein [Candidatus Methanomassiliicoccus intestinalis]|uniref:hypothetical protein n=1 Tax=Candidatus Methanomassiliicoccus intestinalis TaxID=1406512 RepID=UPI0037DD2BF9
MVSKYDFQSYIYPDKVNIILNMHGRPEYYNCYELTDEGIGKYISKLKSIANGEEYENWNDNKLSEMPADKEGFYAHPCWVQRIISSIPFGKITYKAGWNEISSKELIAAIASFRLQKNVCINEEGNFDIEGYERNVDKLDLEEVISNIEK